MDMSSASQPDPILDLLTRGEIRLEGQFLWGSNYTFLTTVTADGREVRAVYKPQRGERPLWDFPDGTLAAREAAAYLTSAALGWDLVPPTVLRREGPAGPGSLQLFLDIDPERHVFTFTDNQRQRLRPAVAFDVLVNNADRKGGHILLGPDGHIWLIDHGVCFHEEDKLRTVLWDFAGEAMPSDLVQDIESFADGLAKNRWPQFDELLTPDEVRAMRSRAERLLAEGRFPLPDSSRPYPWPLV
jgi:hypothetical protein